MGCGSSKPASKRTTASPKPSPSASPDVSPVSPQANAVPKGESETTTSQLRLAETAGEHSGSDDVFEKAVTKFAYYQGLRIAYCMHKAGDNAEFVILQHGFTGHKYDWKEYVRALVAADFTVIAVDALGSGESDAPSDPAFYSREHVAKHVCAVLDAEFIARVHFVGYSRGGHIGVCVIQYAPDRLLSVVLGGTDPEAVPSMSWELFIGIMSELMPGGLPPHWDLPAMRCQLTTLDDPAGAEAGLQALVASGVPTLIWTGKEDKAVHLPAKATAARLRCPFLETPGNHASSRNDAASIEGVLTFLNKDKVPAAKLATQAWAEAAQRFADETQDLWVQVANVRHACGVYRAFSEYLYSMKSVIEDTAQVEALSTEDLRHVSDAVRQAEAWLHANHNPSADETDAERAKLLLAFALGRVDRACGGDDYTVGGVCDGATAG